MLDMDDLSPDLLPDSKIAPSPGGTVAPGSSESSEASADTGSSWLVGKSLKEIERWAIEHTLTLANHNREETARILGISERNLYRKLNEYELR